MANSITKVAGLEMLVFDLDYTLWPFWVDTHVTPPFHKRDNVVYDAHKAMVKYYPEVPAMLAKLKQLGYKIGIASRTSCTDEANDLLRLFDWDRYIDYKEIYPDQKTTHMNRLCQKSGCNLQQICFFDDEHRNIRDLEAVNVCSILVKNGMNFETLREGIDKFKNNPKRP